MKRPANIFTNLHITNKGVQQECSSFLLPLFRSRSRSRSIPSRYGFNGKEMDGEKWNFTKQTFYNTMESQQDPHTGQIIPAGRGYGDMSVRKKVSGLKNDVILKESNIKSDKIIRHTYAEF